ncbi:MAG: phosphonate transport system substrate-binding protein [Flavobacteriales bacterium]|jgi:phosphonate transport system substrate-binding protein
MQRLNIMNFRLVRPFTLIALCLVAPLSFSTFVQAEEASFSFTAIPDQDATELKKRFDKVAHYLTEQLGFKVSYVPVKSYAAAITAFRNNQVQLAWFGGLSGVQARKLVANSEAIAQGYEDQSFVTYFIAHQSTKLKASDNFPTAIKGLSFTFGSKGSTSGRLMPEFYIRENIGVPQDVFKQVGFSGDHSRTVALVQAGSYQVGAVNYKVWDSMLEQGKIDLEYVSVIWKTPAYPDYQWSIRGNVDAQFGQGTQDSVQQALLNMKDPELLKAFPRQSFIPAQNSDYTPIEKTAQSIGLMD